MICDCGKHAWKPLQKAFITFVSPKDDEMLESGSWYVARDQRDYLCVRRNMPRVSGRRQQAKLSREIMAPATGKVVDHINRDPLDNRRENLRVCSVGENNTNVKMRRNKNVPLKGVMAYGDRFFSLITVAGKRHRLGIFTTPEEAHAAYCKAAKRFHGEFARMS